MFHDIVDWVYDPSDACGIGFLRDDGTWDIVPYASLAQEALTVAAYLIDLGVRSADRVCLGAESTRAFVTAFFAVQLLGATAVPLAPPTVLDPRDQYVKYIVRLARATEPSLIMGSSFFVSTLQCSPEGSALPCTAAPFPENLAPVDIPLCQRQASDRVPILQLTSGSTQEPRAVKVTAANLVANIEMIRDWLDVCPTDDRSVSWLPLYHDMGLIGMMLCPTLYQHDVLLMRPDQFIRDPLAWVRCFAHQGCTITATPNFGLRLALRRLEQEVIDEDLSGWRVVIIGAERIDGLLLSRFANRLAPAGFSAKAFVPAYGLAEATLAVTGLPLAEVPTRLKLDRGKQWMGGPVPILAEAKCDAISAGENEGDSSWVVSCGTPLSGLQVDIRDDEERLLEEGCLGEVWVRGKSVCHGYYGQPADDVFTSEGLRTGDVGFIRAGELYVLGRIADSIKVRGKSVCAEEIECRIASRTGIRSSSILVLPSLDAHQGVTVLWEPRTDPPDPLLIDKIRHAVSAALGVEACLAIIAIPRRSMLRTTSGKPRRKEARLRLMSGTYPGARTLFSSHPIDRPDSD